MKVYHGRREEHGCAVDVEEDGEACLLDPRHDLHNHASEDLEWGSFGTGAAQLALALAADVRADALAWARRLSLWDEFRGPFPAQVVGIARVLSLRGMRQFGLHLNEDGHVVPEQGQMSARPTAEPRLCFPLRVRDEEVRVEY